MWQTVNAWSRQTGKRYQRSLYQRLLSSALSKLSLLTVLYPSHPHNHFSCWVLGHFLCALLHTVTILPRPQVWNNSHFICWKENNLKHFSKSLLHSFNFIASNGFRSDATLVPHAENPGSLSLPSPPTPLPMLLLYYQPNFIAAAFQLLHS